MAGSKAEFSKEGTSTRALPACSPGVLSMSTGRDEPHQATTWVSLTDSLIPLAGITSLSPKAWDNVCTTCPLSCIHSGPCHLLSVTSLAQKCPTTISLTPEFRSPTRTSPVCQSVLCGEWDSNSSLPLWSSYKGYIR